MFSKTNLSNNFNNNSIFSTTPTIPVSANLQETLKKIQQLTSSLQQSTPSMQPTTASMQQLISPATTQSNSSANKRSASTSLFPSNFKKIKLNENPFTLKYSARHNELASEIVNAYNSRNYNEVVELSKKINFNPNQYAAIDIDIYLMIVESYNEIGAYKNALILIDKGLMMSHLPLVSICKLDILKMRALLQLGKIDEAQKILNLSIFEYVSEKNPNLGSLVVIKAGICLKKKKFQVVINLIENYLKTSSIIDEDIKCELDLIKAVAFLNLSAYEKAKEDVTGALRVVQNGNVKAKLQLCYVRILRLQNRLEEALIAAVEGLSINCCNQKLYNNLKEEYNQIKQLFYNYKVNDNNDTAIEKANEYLSGDETATESETETESEGDDTPNIPMTPSSEASY